MSTQDDGRTSWNPYGLHEGKGLRGDEWSYGGRQTGRHTDTQTYIQTGIQTDVQTYIQTDIQTYRQTRRANLPW